MFSENLDDLEFDAYRSISGNLKCDIKKIQE